MKYNISSNGCEKIHATVSGNRINKHILDPLLIFITN